MNNEQIIRALRGGRSADRLISDDASALTERVITRANVAGYRTEIATYLTEVYKHLADVLDAEHNLRVELQLDGAELRSHQTVLVRLLTDIAQEPSLPDPMRDRIRATLAEHGGPLNSMRM